MNKIKCFQHCTFYVYCDCFSLEDIAPRSYHTTEKYFAWIVRRNPEETMYIIYYRDSGCLSCTNFINILHKKTDMK